MVRAQPSALFFTALIAIGLASACGGSASPLRDGSSNASASAMDTSATETSDSAEIRDVHAIYRSRCGSCHVRIEPGTHTRSELESAFSRHHTRVKMNDAEWSNMVQLLASDASNNAQANAVSTSK
jgi:hypothetical protein